MNKFIFTKDTNILKALEMGEGVIKKFKYLKLKCIDCVAAEKETLYDAARFHNISLEKLLEELNTLQNLDS
jgi:hybrid cluster-associated redox disulfide protein